ncbi:MAG: RNA polymerase sigma-70 factor [Janthinobacterium lividum]
MSSPTLQAFASWSDEALLLALRADDRAAFAELYERHWYRVFALAYRKLKSRETAEELVQDLFAALWQMRREQAIENLQHYLLTAINRRIISYLRSSQVRVAYADYCRWTQTDASQATEQDLAVADLSEAYAKALLRLPEQSREVFKLSRLEHFSVHEISLRLNLSSKAVEYHLTKSMRLLRGHLRDFVVLALAMLLQQ